MNRIATLTAALALACASTFSRAAPFEIAVSPSRFELSGKSGARLGQSLEIYNVGASAGEVALRTLDWHYSDAGGITYVDALLPDSCRPWVTLERNVLKIGARSKAAFRFQLDIPADAPRRECRFMLAIESAAPAYDAPLQGGGASLSLPVSGRIAIAVYVAVNGAESAMTLTDLSVTTVNGARQPVVTVRNQGDAHGRLDGSLDAVDAKGLQFELVPDGSPVMPGQTRTLGLSPRVEAGQAAILPVYPVRATGTLDWEQGSFKIDAALK